MSSVSLFLFFSASSMLRYCFYKLLYFSSNSFEVSSVVYCSSIFLRISSNYYLISPSSFPCACASSSLSFLRCS